MLAAAGPGFIPLPDRDTTSFLPEKDTTSFPKPPVGPIDPVDPPLSKLGDTNFFPYPVVRAWSGSVPHTTETSFSGDSCRYDMIGNQTYDPLSGHRLTYNEVNRLEKVLAGATTVANYSYLSDGTKLSAVNGSGEGYLYLGSLVYRKTPSGLSLESTDFPGGRLRATDIAGEFCPLYFQTDHLGSVRAVVSETRTPSLLRTVVERNNYHPYGLTWSDSQRPVTDNLYRYNGKEAQGFLSLRYIDYGARQYDPLTGRWLTPDELLEKYFPINSYVFCANNPMSFVDRDGRKIYFASNASKLFKEKFAATIKFMNSRGTSGDIRKLEQSKKEYYIAEGDGGFDVNKNTIFWSPRQIVKTNSKKLLFPATILAHEAKHGVQKDEKTKTEFDEQREPNADNQYGNKLEEEVITTTEQDAAKKHGDIEADEVTRVDHNGQIIEVPNSPDNTILEDFRNLIRRKIQ